VTKPTNMLMKISEQIWIE